LIAQILYQPFAGVLESIGAAGLTISLLVFFDSEQEKKLSSQMTRLLGVALLAVGTILFWGIWIFLDSTKYQPFAGVLESIGIIGLIMAGLVFLAGISFTLDY
jgi:hypothetical protein